MVVTTTADVVDPTDGLISLREAATVYADVATVYAAANGTVTFDATLLDADGASTTSRTIVLTDGQISITKNLTISASGSSVTLDGGNANRIFEISASEVTLDGLTLQNGYAAGDGGAILLDTGTNLTVKNSSFLNNEATNGGAVAMSGNNTVAAISLTIENSFFKNNAATTAGGAIFANAKYTTGAALSYNLTAINSAFSGNTAGYGGAISTIKTHVNLLGSTIVGNTGSSMSGGLIFGNYGGEKLLSVDSIIVGNTVNGSAGDVSETTANKVNSYYSLFGQVPSATAGYASSTSSINIAAADIFAGGGRPARHSRDRRRREKRNAFRHIERDVLVSQ